jgi:hypothetical protein
MINKRLTTIDHKATIRLDAFNEFLASVGECLTPTEA